MSNISSYGYGRGSTQNNGVSAYGYGQGVPIGLVANLDLLTTLAGGLEVPTLAPNLIQATLDLETDFDATLYPLVAEILATLDLTTDLDAALYMPIAELVASLDLETSFTGTLQFITIAELLASLDLTIDLDGALQFITIAELVADLDLESTFSAGLYMPIADLLASLDLTTSFTGALQFIPIAELLASLDIETSLAAQLQFIPIAELVGSLDLETAFTGALQFIPIQELLASLDLATSIDVDLLKVTAIVKSIEGQLGLEVDAISVLLQPAKIIIDHTSDFSGYGPVPPGFLEYLEINGPISSLADMGDAPAEYLEYLKRGGAFSKGGYMFVPVLNIQFKPTEDGPESDPRLIVIGEPQTVTYKPKKKGGATLWKP